MSTKSTIELLRKLPSWEIGSEQETSFLSEADLSKNLLGLREIAFEMDDTVFDIDHEDSVDSLRVLALRNLARTGQREDVDEVLDLILILDYEAPDFSDAVIADFDWLMVRFGEVAIEPLSELASNLGLEEVARSYAVTALTALAVAGHRPTEVWNLFRDLLGKGALHRAVSGLLLLALAENQGERDADFLLAIHDENCVDITMCGDREQLEIMLKLREERETKAPNLAELEEKSKALFYRGKLGELPADASPEVVIEHFLILYQRPSCAKDIEMVHGLLSALIVSPQMAPPSVIISIIWDTCEGNPEKMPIWEGMEELQRFSAAVMEFYNEIVTQFGEGDYLPPLSEVDDEYEEEYEEEYEDEMEGPFYSLDSWAEGLFDAAVCLKKIQGSNEFTEGLAELAGELTIEILKTPVMNEEEMEIASSNMIHFLEVTRNEQQGAPSMPPISPIMGMPSPYDLASVEPVVREEPKIGRNDPCPCGSGKKFKKCCAN